MGAGASVQRGPPGLDGKDGKDGQPGKDGKDAVVDYIQLVGKTVADDSFKAQIRALLNDNAFKTILTNYMNENVGTFKGPKGETEFKNLTAEEQSQIISKLINDNMTTFAVQLMANNSFKDAIVKMLESNPTNFRGPQGIQGPQGVGIKDANYDSATGNLMFTRTDNSTIGSFMVRGADGRPGAPGAQGPAGNIQSAENIAWLQGKTMWCADGSCVVPNGNTIKNKLIRLGTNPDDQSGMTAQGEGLFIKSGVAANTPSTLIKIGDSNYPESGNPEMVFTGFAGGNAYSSAIRSVKGTDLQFITNGETRSIMNGGGMIVNGALTSNGGIKLTGGVAADLKNPDGNLRINRHGIMFGGTNATGKEENSAQISAGIHEANKLNIVGMASGGGTADRKIKAWAEGGFEIFGPLITTDDIVMKNQHNLKPDDDGWIRHKNNVGQHNDRGIATGKLWTQGDVTVGGKLIVNGRDILAELDNTIRVNDMLRLYSIGGGGYLKGGSNWSAGMTTSTSDNWGAWRVTKW